MNSPLRSVEEIADESVDQMMSCTQPGTVSRWKKFLSDLITADRAYYEGEMKEFETLKELYKERCDNANLAWKKAEEWKGLSEKLFAKIGELEETITRLEAKAKKEMGE